MKRFVIQRIGLISATKFGCGLGTLSSFAPGLITALIGKVIISSLRALLENWQNVELANLLGQAVRVNMLTILKLDGALKTLRYLDNASWFFILATVLAWMLLGGLVTAALGWLVTLLYNVTARLFGGIEIELREDVPA